MSVNAKNYHVQGGDELVIGGKLTIKENAVVTGLAADPLTAATADTLGGIKVGSGLSIADGVLSADAYSLPTAAADTKGGVKVGSGLSIADEVLSVTFPQAANQADSTATTIAGLKEDFNTLLAALKTAGLMAADSVGADD